jgi:hypothetical protein
MAGSLAAQTCDRACLEGFVDQYMDALIAHNPSALPLARNLKNTENGQHLEPGDGFWRTATAKGNYKLFVADPEKGEVGFMGVMREANVPVTIALRLKVVNKQISEIESFVVRTGINNSTGAAELEKLGKPRAPLTAAVPASERMSREDLIKTANMYFSGLEKNDGKGVYPFADDCDRLEDGQQTTNNPNFATGSGFGGGAATSARGGRGPAPAPPPPPAPGGINPAAMSCKAAFESGYFNFVRRIRDRRFVVVDVERGLVFSFAFFDHPAGKYQSFKLANGTEIKAGPNRPFTWELAELFKVSGGKIHQVEALLDQAPYGMLSGWSTYEEGMSSKPRTQ